MQTFLTNTSFRIAAGELDSTRLNSQVNEALIILRTLTGWYEARGKKGWPRHTVTQMWKGYEPALLKYTLECLNECGLRHISIDTIPERTEKAMDALSEKASLYFDWEFGDYDFPPWLTEEFASNHRSILLGKVQEAQVFAKSEWYKTSSKDFNKKMAAEKKFIAADKMVEWYQQFNWSEKPATRNEDGRWPFLWPEVLNG